jgi:predicted DNA-binding protein
VRLPELVERRLKAIAASAGITKSDALRMAIAHGLPSLEAGRLAVLEPKGDS